MGRGKRVIGIRWCGEVGAVHARALSCTLHSDIYNKAISNPREWR